MACPFRRAASQQQFSKGGASGAQKPEMRSRQSSVHLPGPEEEDSDRNTLTLKHLSEALKLLTAPSVSTCLQLNKSLQCYQHYRVGMNWYSYDLPLAGRLCKFHDKYIKTP